MEELKSRWGHVKYTLRHKLVILKIWYKENTKVSFERVILHDLDKVFLYMIIGKRLTSKFHKSWISHHRHGNISDEDFAEKYLDYASARHTKPDKARNALDYILRFKPEYKERALKHFEEVKYK